MNVKNLIKERFDEELGKLFDEMLDKMLTVADEAYKCMDEVGMTKEDINDLEEIAKRRCVDFIVGKVL